MDDTNRNLDDATFEMPQLTDVSGMNQRAILASLESGKVLVLDADNRDKCALQVSVALQELEQKIDKAEAELKGMFSYYNRHIDPEGRHWGSSTECINSIMENIAELKKEYVLVMSEDNNVVIIPKLIYESGDPSVDEDTEVEQKNNDGLRKTGNEIVDRVVFAHMALDFLKKLDTDIRKLEFSIYAKKKTIGDGESREDFIKEEIIIFQSQEDTTSIEEKIFNNEDIIKIKEKRKKLQRQIAKLEEEIKTAVELKGELLGALKNESTDEILRLLSNEDSGNVDDFISSLSAQVELGIETEVLEENESFKAEIAALKKKLKLSIVAVVGISLALTTSVLLDKRNSKKKYEKSLQGLDMLNQEAERAIVNDSTARVDGIISDIKSNYSSAEERLDALTRKYINLNDLLTNNEKIYLNLQLQKFTDEAENEQVRRNLDNAKHHPGFNFLRLYDYKLKYVPFTYRGPQGKTAEMYRAELIFMDPDTGEEYNISAGEFPDDVKLFPDDFRLSELSVSDTGAVHSVDFENGGIVSLQSLFGCVEDGTMADVRTNSDTSESGVSESVKLPVEIESPTTIEGKIYEEVLTPNGATAKIVKARDNSKNLKIKLNLSNKLTEELLDASVTFSDQFGYSTTTADIAEITIPMDKIDRDVPFFQILVTSTYLEDGVMHKKTISLYIPVYWPTQDSLEGILNYSKNHRSQ